MNTFRPYAAAFAARFKTMLQYRAAAWAGFTTQCWWGALKVMVFAAFYRHAAHAHTPMTLEQAITYTWLAQALFSLQPWAGDPDIASAVRTGGVSFDRLRPVDTYAWWFMRALAWLSARALPRVALMFVAAAVVLPLVGLGEWAWRPPADAAQAALFVVSLLLMIVLAASFVMLLNLCIAATLTDRGINTFAPAFVILFSGNLIPLGFFPDGIQPLLIAQPFAGMLDIPSRIYIGTLSGAAAYAGLALQAFWIVVFVALGRKGLGDVMARLEVQGG
ncbi:ABC transporter permease [Burkholderia stagnalis]|uniref:ABC transporter permease n=1 Tax=Burkholderia stagnalis TaxID=1503054 RepID=A0A108GA64_9BURK|nr:ABC-2 family transporter protein [Burkholderia stagnalis]KVZ04126.1 ABC transporter permease [Burkholderia stagnalis]KWA44483.1 ABC transporter permease [Burkholderia stagnalis]KWA51868.1 ABC transporter permease [Burkholderia stagnalis]KWA62987.1 ABC transporter permease [Burkholderia stagnalis]KWD02598.1 ABC transporter permease [Burkholderia stagnalis]